MNLSLQDPQYITADFPTTLTTTLSFGHSTSLKISPCGHYIASGLVDGTILVIDSWTNNLAAVIRTHTKPVIGIRWIYGDEDELGPENNVVGLYAWARDWKVSVHILKKGVFHNIWEFVFPGGVWSVDILNCGEWAGDSVVNWKFVICKSVGGVVIVENVNGLVEFNDQFLKADTLDGAEVGEGNPLCCCKIYGGKYVVLGTSKGWVQILDVSHTQIIKGFKICNGNIKGITVVEKAVYDSESDKLLFGLNTVSVSRMMVNSSDRILRQYDISNWYVSGDWPLELEQKYQDVVNRIQWNTLKFSPTGEYVCSSTQGNGVAAHDIYIWETSMGSLVQILEGSNEELIDVDWGYRSTNGNVCCIMSNGMDSGIIYVWGVKASQKWSALAPDFEEIEQNIEYIEHEDEFDLNDHFDNDEIVNNHDFKVDVTTMEDTDARGLKFIRGCIIETVLGD